mmetsp:Transcript_6411/g.10871  ORF Transcript_6411/g.10871 Transcript_6411/m.10871 type:complete len:179 (+) Transcript_6411:124-660(+)|eukprot:CAMPEP_0168627874 /NCGR_PEP_ID=MMETSP0449_2-20121227/11531_1 /TAXON_ID=1082188 /ORGANISM="Strombidium rassoulzadegani, Strain ras09" /LENGTH=178 /DNA_ID=CAMNT_0008670231 /DNA_START=121 /DNA_END=657 /DNA_ORIENTATION=-
MYLNQLGTFNSFEKDSFVYLSNQRSSGQQISVQDQSQLQNQRRSLSSTVEVGSRKLAGSFSKLGLTEKEGSEGLQRRLPFKSVSQNKRMMVSKSYQSSLGHELSSAIQPNRTSQAHCKTQQSEKENEERETSSNKYLDSLDPKDLQSSQEVQRALDLMNAHLSTLKEQARVNAGDISI